MIEPSLGARASYERGCVGCDNFSLVTLYCRKYGISVTQSIDQSEEYIPGNRVG